MSLSTITIAGQQITLVALPSAPGLRSVDWKYRDQVATVRSAFTGQTQRQKWLGADLLSGTAELPPLTAAKADDWEAFLMQLRGRANAFQMGDPIRTAPRGSGVGTPVVDNTVAGGNAPGSETLGTKGWTANAANVLRRGDWIQVGYRLYRALDDVSADGSGNAIIPIWPSIRETPVSNGSSAAWLNATGAVTWYESRPLAWNFESVLWSNFVLSSTLPADAVIQGIYPVFIGSTTFASITTMAFRYGLNLPLSGTTPANSPFTSPSNPDNTTFASTEFHGPSIGTSLSALTGQQILVFTACSLFLGPTLTDQVNVTAVGYAIDYTSAAPVIDPQMPAPFTVSGGHGLAWALPQAVAFTGPTGLQGTATGTPAVSNGGLVLNNAKGLFCLAANERNSAVDLTRLAKTGFPFEEYR